MRLQTGGLVPRRVHFDGIHFHAGFGLSQAAVSSQLKRDFAPFIGSIAMLPVLTKSSRFRHIIGL
jgi:hypothetical protein